MALKDLVSRFSAPWAARPIGAPPVAAPANVVHRPDDLLLPPGYRTNEPEYFADTPAPFTYQPHVYALAGFLAERAGLSQVIDLGSGNGRKLAQFAGRFDVVAVDVGSNLVSVAEAIPAATRIEFDLERGLPPIPEETLRSSVVILSDVIEHLRDPLPLLRRLAAWARICPYVLVSTPDRDRVRGPADVGPPANRAHVREWNLSELTRLLSREGLGSEFVGFTINSDFHRCKSTLLALLGREVTFARAQPVKACAIVHAYNEADIIEECLAHLGDQGLDVILVDNWSDDRTHEKAEEAARAGANVVVRRFPERPSTQYQWKLQLDETVRIAESSGYDWILHNDADEFRQSPWSGVTLAESFAFVQALGYSAVDFTVLDFRYLASQPPVARSVRDELLFFEFGRRPGHFRQVKGWRNQPAGAVDLASSGGHEAAFDGRRVFPLKFLLRHYPLRSEEQARRKITRDRLPRSEQETRERGWHVQYLDFDEERFKGWSPDALVPWNPAMFATEHLVERISGIGLAERA
jgi:SAM-dependent methyltransferase